MRLAKNWNQRGDGGHISVKSVKFLNTPAKDILHAVILLSNFFVLRQQ